MRGVVWHLLVFFLVYSLALSSLLHYRAPAQVSSRDSSRDSAQFSTRTAQFDAANLIREQGHRRAMKKKLIRN